MRPPALDPFTLARWQLADDRHVLRAHPELVAHKCAKMAHSPHAFLRGTVNLFHRVLALRPDLRDGPAGAGWIVGDLHVENFGAYRAESPIRPKRGDDRVVFDVNDFDLAVHGPWRLDLLRLATSLLLAARDRGLDGVEAVKLTRALLTSWRDVLFSVAPMPEVPKSIARLVNRVSNRTRGEMLADRTKDSRGSRRFDRESNYVDLAADVAREGGVAFADYLASLPKSQRPRDGEGAIEDAAFRIAGTGSLGVLRVAVLTRGYGPPDGQWVFDLKESLTPPPFALCSVGDEAPAERVVRASRECLEGVPRMLGTARMGERSMLVRRLSPQEDKLDFGKLDEGDLDEVVRYLGALVARVHGRGCERALPSKWRDADLDATLERSVALAGVHVAAWFAWCAQSG